MRFFLVEQPSSDDLVTECNTISTATEASLDDELLISLVQSKRALWDHRLPVSQRGPAKIKDLWESIAQKLEGMYY